MSGGQMQAVAPKPQRQTLVHGNHASSIGNEAIEGHNVRPKGTDFLDDDVRMNLWNGIRARSSRALAATLHAIAVSRMDELVKEPEELDLFRELLVDTFATAIGKSASKALKMLRGKPEMSIVEFVVLDHEAADKAKSADEGVVGFAIDGIKASAKKSGKAAAKGDESEEFAADKAASISYLDQLSNAATYYYDDVSESVPGMLSDADKILLYKSLDPANGLTPEAILGAITDATKRYLSSPASKIGRTKASRHVEKPEKGADIADAMEQQGKAVQDAKVHSVTDVRDTKLVLHRFRNRTDGATRLYYYKRDYDGGVANMPGGDAIMDEHSSKAQALLDASAKDDNFVLYKEVEPEFYQMAIKANRTAWGKDYDTETFTDDVADMTKPQPEPVDASNWVPNTDISPTGQDAAWQSAKDFVGGGVQAPNKPTTVDSPVMRTD